MSLDNLEDSLKVIVVGDGNVGKTTMLRRYVKGIYSEQYKKTIGADYSEKEIYLKDYKQNVTMMLWDTAGQEVFNALTASYYRNAAACVLAFSTIDRDSFQNVMAWRKKVEAQCGSIVMVLCQTKYDLANNAAMTPQEADQLAGHLNLPFFRISTKEDFNVSALFEFVARECVRRSQGGGDVAHHNAPAVGSSSGAPSSSPAVAGGEKAMATSVIGGSGRDTGGNAPAAASSSSAADANNNNNNASDSAKDAKSEKDSKKDKKDKKEGKDKGDGKDAFGNNVKPIQMKELKKKDKKEKKKGFCVV